MRIAQATGGELHAREGRGNTTEADLHRGPRRGLMRMAHLGEAGDFPEHLDSVSLTRVPSEATELTPRSASDLSRVFVCLCAQLRQEQALTCC